MLIKFLISLKVSFNQAILTSASNLVASEKLLGSGMKCDTYYPNYTKLGDALFSSFTTALKTLSKTFPILLSESFACFRSFFVFLIWSCILNLASLSLSSGCI